MNKDKPTSKKEKIEISFDLREPRIDFGLFRSDAKKLIVKFDWWVEYVKVRSKFESMHNELVKKLPKKILKKVFVDD